MNENQSYWDSSMDVVETRVVGTAVKVFLCSLIIATRSEVKVIPPKFKEVKVYN